MESSSAIVPAEGVRFAVNEDGQELGHAYLYLIKNDGRSSLCGLMEDVFVVESARSKGVGTKLVKLVIEEAKKRGCYKLLGTSRYARLEVHAWYVKLGFKDYGKEFRMDF